MQRSLPEKSTFNEKGNGEDLNLNWMTIKIYLTPPLTPPFPNGGVKSFDELTDDSTNGSVKSFDQLIDNLWLEFIKNDIGRG